MFTEFWQEIAFGKATEVEDLRIKLKYEKERLVKLEKHLVEKENEHALG